MRLLLDLGRAGQDRQEPSWAMLGRLIEDAAFVQVWQSTEFLRRRLGYSVDDVKEATRALLPLIVDHPYHDFLMSYGIDEGRRTDVYRSLLKDLNLIDVEFTAEPALAATVNLNSPARFRGGRDGGWPEPRGLDERRLHQLVARSTAPRQDSEPWT